MSWKKRFLLLILIMTAVATGIAGITLYALYQAAFDQAREQLTETAQSQARLMEAVARHDRKYTRITDDFPDAFNATLSQIRESHELFKGFGKTGEFTLAKRESDQIVFLLSHRHYDMENPKPVPFSSEIAEPMRRALLGKSGTVIGLDYRGVRVLAAHEPVSELDLGIVAKIDMAEIREPFVKAGLLAIGIGLVIILIGTLFFLRIGNPIIRRLEENERKYRGLFESAADTMLMIEFDGTILDANPAACTTYGYRREELIGRKVEEIILPERRNIFKDAAASVLKGESCFTESMEVRRDGTPFAVEVRMSPLLHNGRGVILAATRDITERKRTEEQLQWELTVSKALADLSNALISHESTILDMAKITLQYAKLLTKSEHGFVSSIDLDTGDAVGHTLTEMMENLCRLSEENKRIAFPMGDDGKYPALWGHALNTREAFYTNSPGSHTHSWGVPEGHIPIINFLTVPAIVGDKTVGQVALANAEGGYSDRDLEAVEQLTRLYAMALDVKRYEEEIKKLNEALEQRVIERTAQLRSLAFELTTTEQRERRRLAQILHDHLQQLIVAARMHIDLQRGRVQEDEIRQSLDRIYDLLGDSIEASRSLTFELSPPILYDAGLVASMEWLGRQMKINHGLDVEVDAETEVKADARGVCILLFQAVREALFNVVKHAMVKTARVQIREKDDDQVQIDVADEGVGFDPGRSVEKGAGQAGFGLFSIKERLDLMGGRLEIDSAPGRGTRLTITAIVPRGKEGENEGMESRFPGEVPSMIEPTPSGNEPGKKPRKIRVLLADDHRMMLEGLTRLLKGEADIEIVGEAQDGLKAMEEALRIRPDVVVMDANMPELNGIEATRRIRAKAPEVRVIGLSMYQTEDRAEAMREAGAEAYLSKDGPSHALIEAIRACRAKKEEKG